jgi:hypothetical protein
MSIAGEHDPLLIVDEAGDAVARLGKHGRVLRESGNIKHY